MVGRCENMAKDEVNDYPAEDAFPTKLGPILRQAYREALASGNSVLVHDRDGNVLVRVHPNGDREVVKSTKPWTRVKTQSLRRLKHA